MSTSVLKVKSVFTDGTTKDVSIGPFRPTDMGTYRQKINQQVALLNNPTTREESYPGFTTGFVSNAGANFASIRSAQIITSQVDIIYY